MGLQRVGHDWATEMNWTELMGMERQSQEDMPDTSWWLWWERQTHKARGLHHQIFTCQMAETSKQWSCLFLQSKKILLVRIQLIIMKFTGILRKATFFFFSWGEEHSTFLGFGGLGKIAKDLCSFLFTLLLSLYINHPQPCFKSQGGLIMRLFSSSLFPLLSLLYFF